MEMNADKESGKNSRAIDASDIEEDSQDDSTGEAEIALMKKDLLYNMYFDENEIEKIKATQEVGKFDDILTLRKEVRMSASNNLL
jgi:hypothetical protein